jgi:hypothetical protein
MATAIIEKRNHVKVSNTKISAAAPKLEERTCPIEKLQGNGLNCTICTYYTVVGPVQMIQPTCPLAAIIASRQAGSQSRRLMPSLRSRELRVVRFSPSLTAAPFSPPMTPWASRSTARM